MAISTADKFEFDIPTQADTLNIPPNVLKLVIQRLFGMSGWKLIPDVVNFIEISKAVTPVEDPANPGADFVVNYQGPFLINGVDTIIIGLREGQGTDEASVLNYLCKAAKMVFDLSPWAAEMDDRLK